VTFKTERRDTLGPKGELGGEKDISDAQFGKSVREGIGAGTEN